MPSPCRRAAAAIARASSRLKYPGSQKTSAKRAMPWLATAGNISAMRSAT
jgi:hypothetical protein